MGIFCLLLGHVSCSRLNYPPMRWLMARAEEWWPWAATTVSKVLFLSDITSLVWDHEGTTSESQEDTKLCNLVKDLENNKDYINNTTVCLEQFGNVWQFVWHPGPSLRFSEWFCRSHLMPTWSPRNSRPPLQQLSQWRSVRHFSVCQPVLKRGNISLLNSELSASRPATRYLAMLCTSTRPSLAHLVSQIWVNAAMRM